MMLRYIPHKSKKHTWRTVLFVVFVVCFSIGVVFSVQAYSKKLLTNAMLENSSDVNTRGKIIINFSFPVVPSTIERDFSVVPSQQIFFNWENGNRRMIISPATFWKPATQYELSIRNGRNIFFKQFDQDLTFVTNPYPKIENITPFDGEKNVSVDIEYPIKIIFNRPLGDYNVKLTVNPNEPLDYQLSDDKMQISLLARRDFQWKTKYVISIFIKHKDESEKDYHKIAESFFETAPPPAPVEWEKNPALRLEQAKRYTNPQIQNGKYIDINIKQQVMVIFEDGKPLDAYMISSGKKGMDTPTGNFLIQNKAPRAWSKKYSLFMPNWMAFVSSGEYGIHELPEWPGGYKEGANHLGTPVSHGCVRLGVGPAKRVFDWAELGTPVVIH